MPDLTLRHEARMKGEAKRGAGKRGRKVTLAEIAQEAGVSVGLVSSLLSGRSYVSGVSSGIRIGQGTSRRILETCRQMEYQADRVETYRLIYPERAPVGIAGIVQERFRMNRYHSLILDGVIARTTACSLKLSVLKYDPGTDYKAHPEALPKWVVSGEIDRFIFAGPPNRSLLEILVQEGADVVYASRDPEVDGVSVVVPDYAEAAAIALKYLHTLGHREIGLFGLPYFHGSYMARELLAGARQTLSELNLLERLYLDSPEAAVDSALDSLLEQIPLVSSVFAFDDLSAHVLLAAAMKRDLRIPEDLSIIGCNDEREAALLSPPLSTVHLPVFDIGGRCVDVLNGLAAERPGGTVGREVLPIYLVERASTRPR